MLLPPGDLARSFGPGLALAVAAILLLNPSRAAAETPALETTVDGGGPAVPPPAVAPILREGAEVEGVIHGSEGEPVAEARIALSRVDPSGAHVLAESTDTDQAGRFRIPAVPPGSYLIEVRADGFAPLRHPLDLQASVRDLVLVLEAPGAKTFRTVVQSDLAPLPSRDATTTSTLTQETIRSLPGGTLRRINDVVATQQGVTRDNFGAIHVRGNFDGLLLRVDGIPLPPSVQDRLQEAIESQVIDTAQVIVGGLPAEYGLQVGGVVDIQTRHPVGPPSGDVQFAYGTYNQFNAQGNYAGSLGPVSAVVAGSFGTSARGLDPPAATPILHDQLQSGNLFLRLDDQLAKEDRLELLAVYTQSHYQIPIDPTVPPPSTAPPGAERGPDRYGNTPPDFVPHDSNQIELQRDFFGAVSWFHDFGPRAQLQVAPFARFEQSNLVCDTAGQLGPTADPGQQCSTIDHRLVQGGGLVSETLGLGAHNLKAGGIVTLQRSTVDYSQFTRDDASPSGGADPTATVTGQDLIHLVLAGVYIQDRIELGKLTLFPGLRLDVQQATLEGTGQTSTLWGPSFRLGASYAFTETVVAHAFIGHLWQPPTYDAPSAARALGLVPAGSPIPFDLEAESDDYAEIGIAVRIIPQVTLSLTPWGRLSRYTIDDNEVGDSALTAEYNYSQGRAAGVDFAANVVVGKHFTGFANAAFEVAEGSGIATATYLFTPEQLAFQGYQTVDNAQLVTANVGLDVSDDGGATHLSGLLTVGSGLRTGPTNQATLPASAIIDLTLRHRFDTFLHPELALDVKNVFDVVYAYRIATGSLSGTAYGPLREIILRLIVPLGS